MGDAESLKRQQLRYREMCAEPIPDISVGDPVINRFMHLGVRLVVFRQDGDPRLGQIELVGAAPVVDTVYMTAEEFLGQAIKVWRAIASAAYDTRTVHVIGQSPDSGAWHFYVRGDDDGTESNVEWVTGNVGGVIAAGDAGRRGSISNLARDEEEKPGD